MCRFYSHYLFLCTKYISGGSRNFKTGGRGPGAIGFLRSGDCVDVPFIYTMRGSRGGSGGGGGVGPPPPPPPFPNDKM